MITKLLALPILEYIWQFVSGTDNDTKHICRLCLKNVTEEHLNIFKNRIDNGTHIYVAILSCIQPLKVNIRNLVEVKYFLWIVYRLIQLFLNILQICKFF